MVFCPLDPKSLVAIWLPRPQFLSHQEGPLRSWMSPLNPIAAKALSAPCHPITDLSPCLLWDPPLCSPSCPGASLSQPEGWDLTSNQSQSSFLFKYLWSIAPPLGLCGLLLTPLTTPPAVPSLSRPRPSLPEKCPRYPSTSHQHLCCGSCCAGWALWEAARQC